MRACAVVGCAANSLSSAARLWPEGGVPTACAVGRLDDRAVAEREIEVARVARGLELVGLAVDLGDLLPGPPAVARQEDRPVLVGAVERRAGRPRHPDAARAEDRLPVVAAVGPVEDLRVVV